MAYEQPTWGRVEHDELAKVVVVSPHFDDAALGAAHVLDTYPGSTVVTVFAGRPPAYPVEPTAWDAAGGFVAGDDVVALRQAEDAAAMEQLRATHRWLDFADHQYLPERERPSADEVAPSLADAIGAEHASAVFLPMGLANPDHVVTHEAGLIVRATMPGVAWFCYEDSGYKHIPGMLAWRVTKLFRAAIWPTPAVVPIRVDMAKKRAVIRCYQSQLAPLQADHSLDERLDANVPEQFWRLAAPPRGWEALIDLV